ncbi:MarR family winged helix-turn-helix transcriptional regulator [Herpetosiphon sp. NSE202]|uniref:MarR family winged helix-turn-helix transcriptional regulator n=1 Tax=Herpetosiphon sp. NSE202 TaxID=3351349 RepID=UPI00363E3050
MEDEHRSSLLSSISDMIRQLTWLSHRQSSQTMERLGLTLSQAILLIALDAHQGRASMSDLGRITQHAPATLTGIVDRLINNDLVARERDEQDRRVVFVELTDAGRKKIEAINAERYRDMSQLMEQFDNQELALLADIVQRFVQELARLDAANYHGSR